MEEYRKEIQKLLAEASLLKEEMLTITNTNLISK